MISLVLFVMVKEVLGDRLDFVLDMLQEKISFLQTPAAKGSAVGSIMVVVLVFYFAVPGGNAVMTGFILSVPFMLECHVLGQSDSAVAGVIHIYLNMTKRFLFFLYQMPVGIHKEKPIDHSFLPKPSEWARPLEKS